VYYQAYRTPNNRRGSYKTTGDPKKALSNGIGAMPALLRDYW
jgi:hypothetical protein